MSMSKTLRCALGLCASLSFTGCDEDSERPFTTIDPSKADPPPLDGPVPVRPPGVSSGNGVGADRPDPGLDAGARVPAPPVLDAGYDAGAPVPRGPGDFLSFDAAIALRSATDDLTVRSTR